MILPCRDHESVASDRSVYSFARKPYLGHPASVSMRSYQESDETGHPRRERAKITLPPLSAITSAVNLDDRHQSARSTAVHSQRASTSSYLLDSSRPFARTWAGTSSGSTSERYVPSDAQDFLASSRVRRNLSGSTSPIVQQSVQGSLGSNSAATISSAQTQARPRSLSSPHRTSLDTASSRAQQSIAIEVDRLLESLIVVQDTNKRLGLPIGPSASPTIIQSPNAVNILFEKVYGELDTLAHFSQSRADMVARDLGLLAYTPRPPVVQTRSPTSSVYMSGQPGHPRDTNDRAPPLPPVETSTSRFAFNVPNYPTAPRLPRAASDEYLRGGHSSHYTYQPSHDSLRDDGSLYDTGAGYEQTHQRQAELLDRRHLSGKGMKRVRKRKNEHHQECLGCQAKETPEWRKGPMGPRTLCNACGLLYAKLNKRRQQDNETSSKASGTAEGSMRQNRDASPSARQASFEALRAELDLASDLRNRSTSMSMMSSRTGASGGTSEPGSAGLDPNRQQSGLPSYRPYYHGREITSLPSPYFQAAREGYPAEYPTEGEPGYAYHERASRGRAHTVGQDAFADDGSRSHRSYTALRPGDSYSRRLHESERDERAEAPHRYRSQPSSPVLARFHHPARNDQLPPHSSSTDPEASTSRRAYS